MIGIIPCAGHATRLHGLPKYLLPLGDSYLLAILVRRMFAAGASNVYIGANRENYDLVERYAPDGCTVYLVNSKTMSETVLAARKYAGNEDVLFAMPDTYWTDDTLMGDMVDRMKITPRIGVAGLFEMPIVKRSNVGMCEVSVPDDTIDTYVVVSRIIDKPRHPEIVQGTKGWGVLAWKPPFWDVIRPDDDHVGFAVDRACYHRNYFIAYTAAGDYHDCGTPRGYFRCVSDYLDHEATVSQTQGVNS